jgi:hypothetical protein
MKNSLLCCVLLILMSTRFVFCQTNAVHISITTTYANAPVSIVDSAFKLNDTTHLQIDVLKFYVTNVQFLNKGKIVFAEKNSVHLIDFTQPKRTQFIIQNSTNVVFDSIKFSIGIDSLYNTLGAMGNDLDPTKGMYWTWQSGYINFKLEGESNVCASHNKEFQYHLGGYQYPFNCLQTVILPSYGATYLNINLAIDKLLTTQNLATQHSVMSPSAKAVTLSTIVGNSFSSTLK